MLLRSNACNRASYRWQISTDNTTRTELRNSARSDIEVNGMTPGVPYSFQVQVTTKNGERAWTQSVDIVVN